MATIKQPTYSDFSTAFSRNPVNNDLVRVTEFNAVKRSVRNLILTNKYERLLDPAIGGNVQSLLFEPMDAMTSVLIRNAIELTLQNYEPRAIINQINVQPDYDNQRYFIQIVFSLKTNQQNSTTVEVFLDRIR